MTAGDHTGPEGRTERSSRGWVSYGLTNRSSQDDVIIDYEAGGVTWGELGASMAPRAGPVFSASTPQDSPRSGPGPTTGGGGVRTTKRAPWAGARWSAGVHDRSGRVTVMIVGVGRPRPASQQFL